MWCALFEIVLYKESHIRCGVKVTVHCLLINYS